MVNDSDLCFDRIKAKRILKVPQLKEAAAFKCLIAAGKTSVKFACWKLSFGCSMLTPSQKMHLFLNFF